MKLFDTAHNAYVEFEDAHQVNIYTCGITPYDSAHMGHIFTFMTYDLLQRRLEDQGHEVRLVRNITDVDEPIYIKAAELGIDYKELAAQETAGFQAVLQQLNFKQPYAEPLASDYIQQMASAVKTLLDTGNAYRLGDDIYFDVSQDPEFGLFSNFSDRLQLAFMTMRGGDPGRPGKRTPMDFLLWRGISDPTDPAAWDSPVGHGRPGWHIECTVMSEQLLGVPFDIHGGGDDLIFPHHECEIAQNRALHGGSPARYWTHVAPLLYAGEKMSKSLGNLVLAKDLLQDYSADVIRLALMHYHHRIGGQWHEELLKEAQTVLDAVHQAANNASAEQTEQLLTEVRACLDDDLNTMEVIDALHAFAKQVKNSQNVSGQSALGILNQTLDILGLSAINA